LKRSFFTDADNTLWDTNDVYARAQLAMLYDVEELTCKVVHADSHEALAFVRNIDQKIAKEHAEHLRYPPALLAKAIALALRGIDAANAATEVLQIEDIEPTFSSVALRFIERLKEVPRLREGVRKGLTEAARIGAQAIVLTEGARDKCLHALNWHGLEGAVKDVISLAKTTDAFSAIAEQKGAVRPIMIGDQLDRDILFSAQAGFETFYFPSEFIPSWLDSIVVLPDHQISSFEEVIPFLDA
jgi:putative hydrolase of the HAD superfamily